MFNQIDDPTEMLAWLSQRNHHIPLEDLAYMMESKALSDYPEEFSPADFDNDEFSNIQY